MATKTEKNVQLKINKMTKNIFDQLSVQGLISEDELYLLSDDETGSATWGTIGGELSNQNDLKVMLDSKADKSEISGIVTVVGDDGEIYNNLSAIHLTQYEYYQLMQLSALKPNCLYILDKDNYIDAFGKQIKNLSGPTDLSDAVTKWYVDNAVSSQSIDPAVLSAYALSSDVDARLSQKADKSEIPTVNNPTITFTQGNAVKGSITLNQANDQTISLDAGGGGGGGGGGSGDYVPLSTDIAGNKTAATIGTRNNGVLYPNRPQPIQLSAIGANTFTVGTDCAALSANSFAQGLSCVARGKNSIALGNYAVVGYDNTFLWCGNTSGSQPADSMGEGTFCINNPAKNPEDIIYVNHIRLVDLVSGGDDIYCKYGSTSDDPPGWFFMSITNGQTYIDYSQINSITNNSSKPSKIVGYFEIQADSQDYEIVVGTKGYDYNDNVSFVWKGNAGSNGNIKVPFIIVYNPAGSSQYIQVNGGWSEIYMYITAIYNGGQMKGSFQ